MAEVDYANDPPQPPQVQSSVGSYEKSPDKLVYLEGLHTTDVQDLHMAFQNHGKSNPEEAKWEAKWERDFKQCVQRIGRERLLKQQNAGELIPTSSLKKVSHFAGSPLKVVGK